MVPGCEGVELDGLVSAVRLPSGVALDLGGIGKGFAADTVSTELLGAGIRGVRGVLVNLGGDLRARGTHRCRTAGSWPSTIRSLLDAPGCSPSARARWPRARGTRRAWSRGEVELHHLIDPRTGAPARSGLASVTVVAGEAWRAEVLAKAAFVAGPDEGARLVTDAGATGLLVTDDAEVVELAGLTAFRP